MKQRIANIFYSFPFQLLVLHFRNNITLLATWIVFALVVTGHIGRMFGIHFLFLAPEYLGAVSFWSYLFLGLGFGAFFISWNLTCYILDAHHFPFLASLSRPFLRFCLNNLIIPLTFLVLYTISTIRFQIFNEYYSIALVVKHMLGFFVGSLSIIILSFIYFRFTNKDILAILKEQKLISKKTFGKIADRNRIEKAESIQTGENTWRVDTYLGEAFRPKLVRDVKHYDTAILLRVFRQNHVNALTIQSIFILFLLGLSLAIDNPYFRIPAAASTFVLGCLIISVMGATSYWFSQWRYMIFIVFLSALNFMTSFDSFKHRNEAYGLIYDQDPIPYTYQQLENLSADGNDEKDKANTQKILDNWKQKQVDKGIDKPKMVILCVSGGGLKAAAWSMQVLQESDSILNGQLLDQTTLITGASGGLLGTAYLRELVLQKKLGQISSYYDKKYIQNISEDLLNSLTFTIITNDLFMPWLKFEVGDQVHYKDRGYVFEKQFSENTKGILDKKISDYYEPEYKAEIPMLWMTPSIVNDGRRLLISPHRLSYMMYPSVDPIAKSKLEVDAVDFSTMFADRGAGNLSFTTALRMNATYPYILPNVYFPTQPAMEVMDAGFRDNYGIMSATRFIHVFKDWIKENTSGVVLVQVTGRDKIEEIEANEREGVISSLLNPLGIAGKILSLQDYEQDTNLGYIFELLGEDMFDIVRFVYRPSKQNEKASMTFHLTHRELEDILESYYLPGNQKQIEYLQSILSSERN